MQDAFAHCTDLVRQADRDRFLASLFAPAERRDALFALYAFNIEVARVPQAARETLAGEIRLQWWSEVVGGERREEADGNPVAAALLATVERHRLPRAELNDFIEAHRSALYEEPMATIGDLENHAARTSSALIRLSAHILGLEGSAAADPAGLAHGLAAALRAFAPQASRGRLTVPTELLQRHGVGVHDIFAGRGSPGLEAALAELRDLARHHLAAARRPLAELPDAAVAAFLPVALVRPWLDRLHRADAFAPVELSPWRRQWLIWRAARNPARIAG